MRNRRIILTSILLMLFNICVCVAGGKSPKPVLLVYGGSVEAYMAAAQAAISGVPTVWVDNSSTWRKSLSTASESVQSDLMLDGGAWKYILRKTSVYEGIEALRRDSTFKRDLMRLSSMQPAKKELLTVIHQQDIEKVSESSKSWEIKLTNKQSFQVKYVLDASKESKLCRMANVKADDNVKVLRSTVLSLPQSRALIFVGEDQGEIEVAYLHEVVPAENNLFVLKAKEGYNLPYRVALGQTVGAVVSYCAFFKTSTDKIDLRVLQNELLMYRSRLLPCVDISIEDKHYSSLQRIFLTGILPLNQKEGKLYFNGQDSVKLADVKEELKRLFSRTQLWFVDHNPEYLTLKSTISLLKFAAFRGDELDKEIEQKWKKEFGFEQDYNPERLISKYEFAVLWDKYASPFWVKRSQNGDAIIR